MTVNPKSCLLQSCKPSPEHAEVSGHAAPTASFRRQLPPEVERELAPRPALPRWGQPRRRGALLHTNASKSYSINRPHAAKRQRPAQPLLPADRLGVPLSRLLCRALCFENKEASSAPQTQLTQKALQEEGCRRRHLAGLHVPRPAVLEPRLTSHACRATGFCSYGKGKKPKPAALGLPAPRGTGVTSAQGGIYILGFLA